MVEKIHARNRNRQGNPFAPSTPKRTKDTDLPEFFNNMPA